VTIVERYIKEIDRLDRAILEAQADESLEAEAIAHECLAELYLEWNKPKLAAVYLQDAHDCYTRSGNQVYADNLEQNYPDFQRSSLPQRQQFGGTNYFTDEFVATVSHEFRNPLNGILGMSEALLEEVFGAMNERQLNAVTTIDRSGEYLLALINNMADLSKIQAGNLELEITTVAVTELCHFSSNFVKHHAIRKQIQLDLDIPTDAGDIRVDLQRMQQVLINSIGQAIDSTPMGGKVSLVVTRQSDTIEFCILDTSKQISTIDQAGVAKSPQSHSIDNRRVGLGLMLVHPIVALHGGTLSSESIIGKGSCLKVSLPNPSSIADSSHSSDISIDYLGTFAETMVEEIPEPPLILIVEDNELNVNTIASYLSAKGYRSIVANDGQSAIDLTQQHHPDLILMDIQMPGMDGIEAISRIRQNSQFAETPIIALTALAMAGDRQKCLNVGANEYLTKPVKLKQLNATIHQLLVAKTDDLDLDGDVDVDGDVDGDLWS
jgi:CheY-like chemotaxis protein